MKILIFILFILFVSNGFCQQMVYNKANFFVGGSALVWINGNMESTSLNAVVQNQGEIVSRVGNQNGNFILMDTATINGNGIYKISGNWVNSATFISDSSRVLLDGDQEQLITGDSVSRFHNLELSGSGIKRQTIDAFTKNELNLNDRELAIDSFQMNVINYGVSSILNDNTFLAEGFASTLKQGRLVRNMDASAVYIFPLGSSNGSLRYRPIELELSQLDTSQFALGYNNYNATLDNYPVQNHDSTLCLVNDLFYHKVGRNLGTVPVNVTTYYHSNDGYFNELVNWERIVANNWDKLGMNAQTNGNYRTITKDSITNFNSDAFALGVITPSAPSILGDTIVCDPTTLWTYSASPSNSGSFYMWNLGLPATIENGQNTDVVDVDWSTSNGGLLSVYEIDSLGCSSFVGNTQVNLFPGLNAVADTLNNPYYGLYNFDNFSSGAMDYEWDFGDGTTSFDTFPQHQYESPGIYSVILTIENQFGCTDTDTLVLDVPEGVYIPNIFTPNGDGVNDIFHVNSLGLEESYFSVFNRWGKEVYRSSKIVFEWDGTNQQTGVNLSEGTYFYVFDGKSANHEYKLNGHVTLTR